MKMTGKLNLLRRGNAASEKTRSTEAYNKIIGILTSRLALAFSRPSRNPVFSRTCDLSIRKGLSVLDRLKTEIGLYRL